MKIRDWQGIVGRTLEEKKKYIGKWFVVYYLKENFGEFYTYQPIKFEDSTEILADGMTLLEYNTREQMLEFKEYKGIVY